MPYLLTEKLSDTVIVYLIIKKLAADWTEWDAYEQGIIDENGEKIKKPTSFKERQAWTALDRYVWNTKRILQKFIGQSRFARYATAAYLLKDHIKPIYNVILESEEAAVSLLELTVTKQKEIYGLLKIIEHSLKEAKLILSENKYNEENMISTCGNIVEESYDNDTLILLFDLEREDT